MEFQKSEDTKTKSIHVDPDSLKDESKSSIKIDFMDKEKIKDFVKTPTKESESKNNQGDFLKGKTPEEAAEYVKQEESKITFTPDDLRDVASILVNMYDIGLSTALRAYAGDSTDIPYTINKEKVRRLENMLTLVLVKYQAKFNILFLFFMSLIVISYGPFMTARTNRRIIRKLKSTRIKDAQQQTDKEKKESGIPEGYKIDDEEKPISAPSDDSVEPSEIYIPPDYQNNNSAAKVIKVNKPPRRKGSTTSAGSFKS